jgi:parallel beta-helix repeat protein
MGVIISGESHYNIITDSIISNNYDIGIWLCTSDNTIINNTIINNGDYGVWAFLSSSHNISHNLIDSNSEGIHCDGSSFNEISYNTIKNNNFGISLSESTNNRITGNNFIKNNEKNAQFAIEKLSNCKNTWNENFWNRPRFLPKLIIGRIGKYYSIPWINIDWHAAKEPYNI